MGDSHFKSNVYGKAGTETIRGFTTISATTLTGQNLNGFTAITATAMSTPTMTVTTLAHIEQVTATIADISSHIKLADHQYVLAGAMDSSASVVAAATAIDASIIGTLYLGADGQAWICTADDTAATLSST